MKKLIIMAAAFTLLSLTLSASFSPAWLDKCQVVESPAIYVQGWDKLPQVRFWKETMATSSDSFLINEPVTRTLVGKVSRMKWEFMSGAKRQLMLDGFRKRFNIAPNTRLVFTEGRKEYYNPSPVLSNISKAIEVFEQSGVDPWYAQAILLIESPGQIRRSEVGAYGPFQLMPSIARAYGLQVDGRVDERADLHRSARAAARLIQESCIPLTARMLDRKGIAYSQDDLWFKVLALHVYHAGSGNVSKALSSIRQPQYGMNLLAQLWNAEAGGFRNASQNYGPIALAALLQLDELLHHSFSPICQKETKLGKSRICTFQKRS
ncbi:MAG: transglycosylase SLT domain-containing protein [Bacteroidia bacterium]